MSYGANFIDLYRRASAYVAKILIEIKIQGGAGQGVQVGCRILADAFVRAGASVRAFATDGSKGRDSSVVAFVRVARVVAVDAADIAGPVGLGPLVAFAVVGAFGGATGLLGPDDLVAAVRHGGLDRKAENVAACIMAYRETAAAAGRTEVR